jgi:hypothetical protein
MKKEKEKGITITLVGKQEPNIINNWLDENGIIEIAKQVEKEAKDLCEQETLEEDKNGTIIQFLCGSHSYDGVWFGDKHPYREGNFWWRSILQEQDKNKYSEEEVINILEDAVHESRMRDDKSEKYIVNETIFEFKRNKIWIIQ